MREQITVQSHVNLCSVPSQLFFFVRKCAFKFSYCKHKYSILVFLHEGSANITFIYIICAFEREYQ